MMGAHPFEYARLAPPHSFLHVDWFRDPQDLAQFLHLLNSNESLYSKFFQWKNSSPGVFWFWNDLRDGLSSRFYCSLCFVAHFLLQEGLSVNYKDVDRWWLQKFEPVCIGNDRWESPRTWQQILSF